MQFIGLCGSRIVSRTSQVLAILALSLLCAGQSCAPPQTSDSQVSDEQVLAYVPPPPSIADSSPDNDATGSDPLQSDISDTETSDADTEQVTGTIPSADTDLVTGTDPGADTSLPTDTGPTTEPVTDTALPPDTDPIAPEEPVTETAPPDVRIAVVPGLHRVFNDDIGLEGSSEVNIQCARGETESCQVVVVNYGSEPLQNINLDWSLEEAGAPSSGPTLTPFRVHYVEVRESGPGHQSAMSTTPEWEGPGWYPDALIPFMDPYSGEALASAQYMAAGYDLPGEQCQPYWLDFTAALDTPPGQYYGSVRITADGFSQQIPVQLTVWDFSLSASSSLPTWFGCSTNRIETIYRAQGDARRLNELRARHVELLESHRLFSISLPTAPLDPETGHARIDLAYLSQIREIIERNDLKVCRLTMTENSPIPDAFGSGWERFKTYLRDLDRMLKNNRWIPPAFVYIVDEPNTELEHDKVYQLGQFLRSENLSILNFVTGSLQETDGWAPLEGSIDIWTYFWGRSFDLELVADRQAAGYRVWSYSALSNRGIGPSWLLDAPLVDYMAPFWISWSLQLDGLLYWTVLLDSQSWGVDPWINPATLAYSDGLGGILEMNGEGTLLMPGLPAGVDGPLPTIRLKTVRDGLDCHKYLRILSDLGGRSISDEVARGVAASYREWSSDYAAYLAARQLLVDEILARR